MKFIADIGSNHNGDLNRALELIKTCSVLGCDAVKFQLYDPKKLNLPSNWRMPTKWLPFIKDMCRDHKVEFHCTPFDLQAVDDLEPYVDAYKIGSYEILCTDMILKCFNTGKPIGISLGMAKAGRRNELSKLLEYRLNYYQIIWYQCVSEYPAPLEGSIYPDPHCLGYSDHTHNPAAIYAAAAHYFTHIEFHIDNEDGLGFESGFRHCWKPSEIGDVIRTSKDIRKAVLPKALSNVKKANLTNPKTYTRGDNV